MVNGPCTHPHNVVRKNRRLYYLTHVLRPQGYFSDAEMQQRDPVLYHEYVGQYIPDTLQWAPFPTDLGLVDRVYYGIDQENAQQLVEHHRRSQRVVEDTDADPSGQPTSSQEKSTALNVEPAAGSNSPVLGDGNQWYLHRHSTLVLGNSATKTTSASPPDNPQVQPKEGKRPNDTVQHLDTRERQLLYQDLVSIFEQRFLAGEDRDFDYSLVDSNPSYDDVHQLEQDQQDAYFDAEDSE
ncbi:hypothetical protein IWQ62_003320 [Dispira parvispora]|uniref:CCD97-like C-terminal domain-containing protein n=1 Tax=Dispira parvispora TaxID=1520584 RepID=A0A9W8AUE2_9FUNG|nr:hypothetical protein IWQ62_003320 [Dispira parvispora]